MCEGQEEKEREACEHVRAKIDRDNLAHSPTAPKMKCLLKTPAVFPKILSFTGINAHEHKGLNDSVFKEPTVDVFLGPFSRSNMGKNLGGDG